MIPVKRCLAILLCCCLTTLPLPAQTAGAMLYSTGQVTVNGRAVANPSAIFPGDSIQVAPNSSASVTGPGLNAEISPQSAVSWQQNALEFQAGSITVSGQAPWQIHIGSMTVSLGSQMSKVEIIQREDVALVKLDAGSANLDEAGQTSALKVGFTVARPHTVAVEQAGKSVPAATTGAHSSHIGIIAVVVGGAAAAGIGLGLKGKGTSTPTPVSPTVP